MRPEELMQDWKHDDYLPPGFPHPILTFSVRLLRILHFVSIRCTESNPFFMKDRVKEPIPGQVKELRFLEIVLRSLESPENVNIRSINHQYEITYRSYTRSFKILQKMLWRLVLSLIVMIGRKVEYSVDMLTCSGVPKGGEGV